MEGQQHPPASELLRLLLSAAGNSLPSGSHLLATHRFMQLLSYHLLREAFPAHVISSLAFTLFFFIALFHFKYFIINCVLFIFSLPP